MVAQFHEEPADDPITARIPPVTVMPIIVQKTNPLAKGKSKIGNRRTDNRDTLKIDYLARRQSSMSSDDIDVPAVSKTMENGSDEFDCWLSDTNQRRSPEGGEDSTTVPGTQEPSVPLEKVSNDVVCRSKSDSSGGGGSAPEKKHKSKKKKEKKDRDERKEKKKKRKSRDANDLEEFLNGTDNDGGTLVDSAYEAI